MVTRTYMIPTEQALAERQWCLIDAQGKVLGRLASKVADLLRGKTNPKFTPHVDTGSFVVVVNVGGLRLSGDKVNTKEYHRHSGFPGGMKTWTAARELERNPERMFELAVRGMLPKNRLGRRLATKLKIYRGSEHPHAAQAPVVVG